MYCLITGSSRGLGKIIALALLKAGHTIAFHGNANIEKIDKTIFHMPESLVFKADLCRKSDVESMTESIARKWGRLDVLVNNAGITKENLILKTTGIMFTELIDLNLRTPFILIKNMLPLMKKNGGHIINIGSISGLKGRAGLTAYSASKAGLIGFTKSLAKEVSAYNIRVNAVLPGYLLTDMGKGASSKAREDAFKESLLSRYAEPQEVAEFVNFLVNTKCITGQVFNLDSRIF